MDINKNKFYGRFTGKFLLLLSALVFSFMSLFVKIASEESPSFVVLFARCFCAWIFNLFYLHHDFGWSVSLWFGDKKDFQKLLLRCFFGSFAMACFFFCISQLTLSDANVLMCTSPIFTFLFAYIFLNEKANIVDFSVAIISFVGILFVLRPTFLFHDKQVSEDAAQGQWRAVVVFIGLIGSAATGGAFVCIRSLQNVSASIVVNYHLGVGVIIGIIGALSFQSFTLPYSFKCWAALIGTGVSGFFGQWLMTVGFQLEPAGPASVIRFLDIVFVFFWDYLFMGEPFNKWSVSGATIVFFCIVVMTLNDFQKKQAKK